MASAWPGGIDGGKRGTMEVDLILLSRDLSAPREDVWRGIQIQAEVAVRLHRLEGTPRAEDANRYETIARARNRAKTLGISPWVMFLDDDVVLGAECLDRLVHGLGAKMDSPPWARTAPAKWPVNWRTGITRATSEWQRHFSGGRLWTG